ncbi:hypothetical protein FACS1894139_09080 [Planctomycetales bacterium]|nr:hypothetical protein FACS1894107_11870 [Planctomycetales bacterium]GHS98111.1 hypothetical protein FACS1894108_05670 [Planctomycetales bacterium]GHT05375.1 hypothetical protein FACS1894139_09080 [Planctomycetales bacterium]
MKKTNIALSRREPTLAENRRRAEAAHGQPTTFYSAYPLIGRGNVMRDYFVSHQQVEDMFAHAVRSA